MSAMGVLWGGGRGDHEGLVNHPFQQLANPLKRTPVDELRRRSFSRWRDRKSSRALSPEAGEAAALAGVLAVLAAWLSLTTAAMAAATPVAEDVAEGFPPTRLPRFSSRSRRRRSSFSRWR